MRAWVMALALVACDSGGGSNGDPGDRGVADGRVERDETVPDAGPVDAAVLDGGAADMARGDAAAPDAGGEPPGCLDRGSARPADAWRVRGCALVRGDDLERLPRAVVISADSLARDARTPLHTAVEYADLAGRVDWVWLLVTWDGIEPSPGTYNGAYLGRICEQVDWATAAGLQVVLAMHQERFSPALGGHGFPAWLVRSPVPVPPDQPDHPAVEAAWAAFWADPDQPAALAAAWGRLLNTCAGRTGIVGLHPLTGVRGPTAQTTAFFQQIRMLAESSLGPLLLFADGDVEVPAPDTLWAPTAFGAGRGPDAPLAGAAATTWIATQKAHAQRAGVPLWIRSAGAPGADLAPALAAVEHAGAAYAVWHDGFGRDAWALRDMDGRPGPTWHLALARTRPLSVAGVLSGYGPEADAWTMAWFADGRGAGLSRIAAGPLGPDPEVELTPADTSWFSGYDGLTDEVSVFVQGAAGPVEVRLRSRGRP